MHRSLLLATPLLAGLVFSGCWVTWEEECTAWPFGECDSGGWNDASTSDCGGCDDGCDAPDGPDSPPSPGSACVPGERRFCDTPTYCSWGEQVCASDGSGWGPCYETTAPPGCGGWGYDPDCCVEAGACCQDWYDEDLDGDWNDSIGNCEEPPPPCADDAECEEGYCDAEDGALGRCVVTGACSTDEDCAAFGPGFACDERGLCAPEEAPCPTGECGCSDDADCDDGLMCLQSRCTPPDAVCFFDFECGEGQACLDNACHRECASDDACLGGQICLEGVCVEPALGSDGCVFDEDCGESGFVCVNASCLTACADDSACAEGETCRAGSCRADGSPSHECAADADCPAETTCHRGACRLPCVADINCSGDLATCGPDGYCIADAEVAPECLRADDCGEGRACLSNACVAF